MVQINFITANLSRDKQIEFNPSRIHMNFYPKSLEPNIVEDFLAARCKDNKEFTFWSDITSSRPDVPTPLSVVKGSVELSRVDPSF